MFKIGDTVKVKAGTKDVHNPDYDMSGFQGVIEEIDIDEDDENITFCTVKWDNVTMNELSDEFWQEAYDEGETVYYYVFIDKNLEPATPRPEVPINNRELRDKTTNQKTLLIQNFKF